jgi:ubiquinone/menaquinone biosynthesis C-methylase UbiE
MKDNFSCLVCEAHKLTTVSGFSNLPRVTSDSRQWPSGGQLCVCETCGAVQKLPTETWHAETQKIYSTYDLWPMAKGREQPIFSVSGESKPRSNLLIEFLLDHYSAEVQGELLDVGCGTGAALGNFSRALPSWNLFAADLSDRLLPALKQIPLFKELFVGPIENINHRFNLITMIHSLEHFPLPYEALCKIRRLLSENGTLLVAVPNAEASPFDFLVVDHLVHFGPEQLAHMVQRAGLKISHLRVDVLPKEISILAMTASEVSETILDPSEIQKAVDQAHSGVQWLSALLRAANESSNQARRSGHKFGIFGTSISGMWLFGAMENEIDFFVDEDVARQGACLEGHPVIAPEDVPNHASVFLALLPDVAINVKSRLASCLGNWIVPPPRQ